MIDLLYIIIEYLDQYDIKNIRLVNKIFCHVAKKYKFESSYGLLCESNINSLNYIFTYNNFELDLKDIMFITDTSLEIDKIDLEYKIFSRCYNSKLYKLYNEHELICDKFEFFLNHIKKTELLNIDEIIIINISFKKIMNIYYGVFKKYYKISDIFDKLYNPILDILKSSSDTIPPGDLYMDHNIVNNKTNILIFDKIFLTDFLIECLEKSSTTNNKFYVLFSRLDCDAYNTNFLIDFDILYDYILKKPDKIYLFHNFSYYIYEFLLKNCNNKLINLYYDYFYKIENNMNCKEITIGYNTVGKNKNKYYNKIYDFLLHKENLTIRYDKPPKKYKKYKKYRLRNIPWCTNLNNKTFNNNFIKYKTKYCLDNDLI